MQHHAALPWGEIGAFMAELTGQAGVAALALRFAVLTAARTGEIIGARWAEIDLSAGVWTVPEARMKAAREHRVPLPEAALAVLREAGGLRKSATPDAFVFPGGKAGRGLSNMALLVLLRRMGRGDLTAHGFRSTFRDWPRPASRPTSPRRRSPTWSATRRWRPTSAATCWSGGAS
jgi:integrase